MSKDLTSSNIARQNVLNNEYAVQMIEAHLSLGGTLWQNQWIFTKLQIANLLDIDVRTIERYLEQNQAELVNNGYRVVKGTELREIKKHVSDIDVGDKSPSLGIFTFRTLLNIAMLVTESERAKAIRSKILDIVIDVVAEKAGGQTKYINQRDEDYLPAAYEEYSYRKAFTDALRDCLGMGNIKYGIYTDRIYQAVFLENATEYKKILNLADKDKTRDTMYTEVLRAIASFEHGLAEQMKSLMAQKERKLTPSELDEMIRDASANPYLKPIIEDARVRMASRDLCFRDALHHKLESYIKTVPKADFDKFLGEKSKSLEEQLSDTKTLEVLKRLKDR